MSHHGKSSSLLLHGTQSMFKSCSKNRHENTCAACYTQDNNSKTCVTAAEKTREKRLTEVSTTQ